MITFVVSHARSLPSDLSFGNFGNAAQFLSQENQSLSFCRYSLIMAPTQQEDGYLQGSQGPKRHKKVIEDDLICPITHELPFDPVIAMDGRVYEKEAIETYFSGRAGGQVKSPMTSEMIPRTLLPAPQHRNIIEASIANGFIKGNLATKWNQKVEETMETLIKKAKEGDAASMHTLGKKYSFGEAGLEKDYKKALEWYEKAHVAGNQRATAKLGEHLVKGVGTDIDLTMGAFYLGFAAGKGSCFAAFILGKTFANGYYGFKKNVQEGKLLLEMATSSESSSDLTETGINEAQQLLDELKNQSA